MLARSTDQPNARFASSAGLVLFYRRSKDAESARSRPLGLRRSAGWVGCNASAQAGGHVEQQSCYFFSSVFFSSGGGTTTVAPDFPGAPSGPGAPGGPGGPGVGAAAGAGAGTGTGITVFSVFSSVLWQAVSPTAAATIAVGTNQRLMSIPFFFG